MKKSPARKKSAARPAARATARPRLLSGGNPQIAKAEGDQPVQAYIAAMPGWKRAVGAKVDAIVTRTVPDVQKAVKWNSPLYGAPDRGWFLGVHCFAKYIKIAFFNGVALKPLPPIESKDPRARYFHISEVEPLNEKQFTAWVKQASRLPGWVT